MGLFRSNRVVFRPCELHLRESYKFQDGELHSRPSERMYGQKGKHPEHVRDRSPTLLWPRLVSLPLPRLARPGPLTPGRTSRTDVLPSSQPPSPCSSTWTRRILLSLHSPSLRTRMEMMRAVSLST